MLIYSVCERYTLGNTAQADRRALCGIAFILIISESNLLLQYKSLRHCGPYISYGLSAVMISSPLFLLCLKLIIKMKAFLNSMRRYSQR